MKNKVFLISSLFWFVIALSLYGFMSSGPEFRFGMIVGILVGFALVWLNDFYKLY